MRTTPEVRDRETTTPPQVCSTRDRLLGTWCQTRTVVVKCLCADAASKHGSLTWTPVKMRFSGRIGPPVTWSPQHGGGQFL